jgi:hypothetical protein
VCRLRRDLSVPTAADQHPRLRRGCARGRLTVVGGRLLSARCCLPNRPVPTPTAGTWRGAGPIGMSREEDVRVDGDHCLTESSVELGRRGDLVANEVLVVQPVHREILPVQGQALTPSIHISRVIITHPRSACAKSRPPARKYVPALRAEQVRHDFVGGQIPYVDALGGLKGSIF